MSTKTITLYAYNIVSDNLNDNDSDFSSMLVAKFRTFESEKSSVADRILETNKKKCTSDVLTNFHVVSDDCLTGTISRIRPAKGVGLYTKEMLAKLLLQKADVLENAEDKFIVYGEFNFAIKGRCLVSDTPRNNIKGVQTYLRWLLGTDGIDIIPMIAKTKSLELRNVSSVCFSDMPERQKTANNDKAQEEKSISLSQIGYDWVRTILCDATDANDILSRDIISATLQVKFNKKPKKLAKEDYERQMGLLIRPFDEESGFSLTLKNGMTLTGNEVITSKEVDVDMVDEVNISEENLKQELLKYLNELI